ncbi:hypothetical protein OLX02_19270 [Novosphingobium sp. KCTC 2891]|uniref:ATP-binding protein n=1 Tax=Novosphingobium sp. KCTC 2891 TaxID=2989730 RepID=UPI0022215ACF|nr:ATP-binding protein [Novosphingobium sp. KCTC 2891]MCW1384960.1 hypothetical protein [Novosphingobium sp. KCTC 2891]
MAAAGAARVSERPRRPGLRLLLESHLLFALFVAALLAALSIPRYDVLASPTPGGVMLELPGGGSAALPAAAPVRIAGPSGMIAVPAGSLVPDHVPPGGPEAVARFYRERSELGRVAGAPGAVISAADRARSVAPQRRHLTDLPHDFWLLSLQAVVIGLIGTWVRIGGGGDIRARMFGVSCAGVAIAGLSGAVFDTRDLTAPGALLQAMMTLNFIGSNLSAVGLFALFLYVPRRIAPVAAGWALVALAVLAGTAQGLGLLPLSWFYALLLGSTLGFPVLAAIQYRRARGEPAARATLRWIGANTFAGAAFVTFGMAAPILLDVPSLGSDGMTIVPLFLVYGGIAFGIAGRRMFELDRWSYRLALGAGSTIALLLADALLINLLSLDRPVALAVAVLGIGYLYVPLRALLWSKLNRRRTLTGPELFRMASEIAFAHGAPERRRAWRTLLDRLWQPLDIAPASVDVAAPTVIDAGEALLIPAAADEAALCLRHARNGARLFGAADLATLRELLALLDGAEAARAEYARGVSEERQRIARDLHDDVSGLLLTGLHREDLREVRGDVQQALGEIRAMMSSLAGHAQPLGLVLADCRYEASGRLSAAGIALDWPVDLVGDAEDIIVEYGHHKALVSALREVVTNTIRHSGASVLTVSATARDGALSILARDDGRGFSAGEPRRTSGGNGLGNLAQRLAEIGGRCAIEPAREGFAVRLTLPLAQPLEA